MPAKNHGLGCYVHIVKVVGKDVRHPAISFDRFKIQINGGVVDIDKHMS
jgi:hypothetical protein